MDDFVKINDDNYSRRLVISDIHGCYLTFRHLVESVLQVSKSDQLFLLGDYVDRGPSSKEVLDYIIGLMEQGYRVFPLIGNHEEDLLRYSNEEERFLEWHLAKNSYPDILEKSRIKPIYLSFLESLPYYYEVPGYYIVHAGFDFTSKKPFENKSGMLWIRDFIPDTDILNNRRIVHGHNPVYMKVIEEHILNRKTTVPLDNGAVYSGIHKLFDTSQLGRLCAYNLDTEELFSVKNIDLEI